MYDLLDALRPAHLKAVFYSLSHRTRWIIITSVAVIALMWSALMLVQVMMQHVRNTTGPFLFDALVDPYGLEVRLIPALTGDLDLPPVVGSYTRSASILNIASDATAAESAPETEAETVEPAPVRSATAECLLTAASDSANPLNCTGYQALYAASTEYQTADGVTIQVNAARFPTDAVATEAMNALHTQAGTLGRTGNFAIGVTAVDYFYSSANALYSFTWSNAVWVYTVSSPSFDQLEAFVKAFPY